MQKTKRTAVQLISTFFGIGYISMIGPTWASLTAVIIAWFLGPAAIYTLLAVCTAAGFWACQPAREVFAHGDPRQFVMDEVSGMLISILFLPKTIAVYILAFTLFRLFDAWKPWPISRIQQSKAASSIMWDDVAAGLVANFCLQMIVRFGGGLL